MPARNFLTVPYASTLTLDADQSKNFQVTLAGSPTITLAGGRDGDEITVALTQGGSGSYNPTWANVTWQAGYKPNLNSAVGGLDTITLIRQGSTWTDKGGAPSKLPSRVAVAAMTTMVGLILGSSGTALMTTRLSGGSGTPSEIGKVSDNRQVYVGSGSNATMVIKEQGSGGYLLSSSGAGIGVGVPNLKAVSKITDAAWYVTKTGATKLPIAAGQAQGVQCTQTGGKVGICTRLIAANGTCVCGSL